MGDAGLRVRSVADEYYFALVVASVLLVATGGFLVYGAYAETTERTETTVASEVVWTSTGQFTHQATVRNDTRVFEVGETLTNRSAYFRKIAPRMNGSFVYNYTADSGNLTTATSLKMRIRSVAGDGASQREYWRIERALDSETRTLEPNETLRLTFSQNVSQIAQEIDRIQSQLGTTAGTVETTFVAAVQLDGTRNGRPVSTNRTYSLPLTIESDLYRMNDSGPVVEQGERPVRNSNTVVVEPGSLWRYGGPLALLVGVVGLFGLAYGRFSKHLPVTEHEREYLSYRTDREEFDEWITEARFPADRVADAETRIETTSLAGLVDLAIDTDRRVIEVADRDHYLVIDGDVVYAYGAPTLEATADPLEPSADVTDEEPGSPADRPAVEDDTGRDDDSGATPAAESDSEDDEAGASIVERLQRQVDFGRRAASDGATAGESDETTDSETDETADEAGDGSPDRDGNESSDGEEDEQRADTED